MVLPEINTNTSSLIELTIAAGQTFNFDFNITLNDSIDPYALNEIEFRNTWLNLANPIQEGNNTLVIDARNLSPGSYDEYISLSASPQSFPCSENARIGASSYYSMRVRVNVMPSQATFVSNITIANADTDKLSCSGFGTSPNVIPLVNTFSFDAGCLPDHLSFIADVYGQVGSVVFEYSYTAPGETEKPLKYLRTENISPYASFGDSPRGDFVGIPKQSGLYKLRATPYSGIRGKGIAGNPLEIRFTIANPRVFAQNSLTQNTTQEKTNTKNPDNQLVITPNPVTYTSTINYHNSVSGFVSLELFDLQGNLIRRIYQGKSQANQPISLPLNRQGLREGVYILRKQDAQGIKINRVMIK